MAQSSASPEHSHSYVGAPVRLEFGPGRRGDLGRIALGFGAKLVVVTGRSAERQTEAKELIAGLRKIAPTDVHSDIDPGVSLESIGRLRTTIERAGADVVIAYGSGSVLDTAKAALYGHWTSVEEASHVDSLAEGPTPSASLIAIPTTFAGTEMTTGFTATTSTGHGYLSRRGEECRPKAVVYDPELVVETPTWLRASSLLNALAHGVERLLSRDAQPISDALVEAGVDHLWGSLPGAGRDNPGVEIIDSALLGACLCAMPFENVGVCITHALSHALRVHGSAPHGHYYAVLLPHGMAFNAEYAPDGWRHLASALGRPHAQPTELVGAVCDVRDQLQLPSRLRDLGVDREALRGAAESAMDHFGIRANPRPVPSAETLLPVLEAAW